MLIYRGAEAELYREKFLGMDSVRKVRKEKKYKQAELDRKLRTERLKTEAKMLSRARAVVSTPRVLAVQEDTLILEYIDGEKVKDLFLSGQIKCASKIGKGIAALHSAGIVHNDLTTGNLILKDGKIFFIDFGLAQVTSSLEDRAVDLVVFKRMLSSTHYDIFEKTWTSVIKAYGANKAMLAKIAQIESRAKYR